MQEDTVSRIRDRRRADKEVSRDAYRIKGMESVQLVLDVGAYHGSFSRYAKTLYPYARVCAFEPAPDSFELLRRTTPNVECFNYAVAGVPGRATLNLSEVPSCNTLDAKLNRPTGQRVAVECITLMGFLMQHHLHYVDILKLDCEGQEANILEGMQRVGGLIHLRYITMEWHGDERAHRVEAALADTHSVEVKTIKAERGYIFAHIR